jgi:hypothetical protein
MFFEIGQEHPAHRERRVSAGEPHRRKPGISAADARQQRKLRAGRVVINSFILLIVSFVVRTRILWFFGISLAEALFMQRKRWRQSRTCAPACIIEIECMRTAILPH